MKKIRWILRWSLLFSFLMADDYRTITRPSSIDIQKFKRVALVIGNDNYESIIPQEKQNHQIGKYIIRRKK